MAKARTVFVCEACGNETLKWEGGPYAVQRPTLEIEE